MISLNTEKSVQSLVGGLRRRSHEHHEFVPILISLIVTDHMMTVSSVIWLVCDSKSTFTEVLKYYVQCEQKYFMWCFFLLSLPYKHVTAGVHDEMLTCAHLSLRLTGEHSGSLSSHCAHLSSSCDWKFIKSSERKYLTNIMMTQNHVYCTTRTFTEWSCTFIADTLI